MIKLKNRGQSITEADLDALESAFQLTLPRDYRLRMLRDNGGDPVKRVYTGRDGERFEVRHVYSIKYDEGGTRLTVERAIKAMVGEDRYIKPGRVPVATDGFSGKYCLIVEERNPDRGAIFRVYLDGGGNGEAQYVADSLDELLKGLETDAGEDEYLY